MMREKRVIRKKKRKERNGLASNKKKVDLGVNKFIFQREFQYGWFCYSNTPKKVY
jgi:hypothetical protein